MKKDQGSNPRVWRRQPKQERAANTVDCILQAAEQLFVANGFHSTTVDDIVRRAGIGVGSLYGYFPNKTSIALALLESVSSSIADDSRKYFIEYGKDPVEASLPKVVRRIYHGYKRHKNVLINLVNEVPTLRADAELYSLDRLIHRASLIYLQIYADRYTGKSIEVLHAFLNVVFIGSIKQYLAESNPRLDEDAFLDHLSMTILVCFVQPRTAE